MYKLTIDDRQHLPGHDRVFITHVTQTFDNLWDACACASRLESQKLPVSFNTTRRVYVDRVEAV